MSTTLKLRYNSATIKIEPEVRDLLKEKAKKSQTYSQYIRELIQYREEHSHDKN